MCIDLRKGRPIMCVPSFCGRRFALRFLVVSFHNGDHDKADCGDARDYEHHER